MSTSAISGSTGNMAMQGFCGVQRADNDGDDSAASSAQGASGKHHHHHGGGGLMHDLMQALQSSGLSFPDASTQTASTQGSDQTTGVAATGNDPRAAMHQLMGDLRQALQQINTQQATQSTDTTTATPNGYNDLNTNLQSLITMLGSNSADPSTTGSTTTTNSDITGKLNSDFQNLVSMLGGSSSGVTLQSVLSKVESNLTSYGSTQGTGVSVLA
ncbi:MAG TPA: hypothetical protein VMH83_00050 [Candidatus Acidoferrum sp.]|nr:hypothetical protein [Candidatus Acidoferrum sp.]